MKLKYFVFGLYSDGSNMSELNEGYSRAMRGFDEYKDAKIFADGVEDGGANGYHKAVVVPYEIGVDVAAS